MRNKTIYVVAVAIIIIIGIIMFYVKGFNFGLDYARK